MLDTRIDRRLPCKGREGGEGEREVIGMKKERKEGRTKGRGEMTLTVLIENRVRFLCSVSDFLPSFPGVLPTASSSSSNKTVTMRLWANYNETIFDALHRYIYNSRV